MPKGSCLCGKITYEAAEIGATITKCHCTICQKLSGSAYGDYTTAPLGSFKWTSDETLVESAHMFLRSSAPWHKRQQGFAEFQEYPSSV